MIKENFTNSVMTLTEKKKSEVTDRILKERLNNILPKIMDEQDIDFWIVMGREFNEGPLLKTFFPSNLKFARRNMILLFAKDGDSVECMTVYPENNIVKDFYKGVLRKDEENDWECINRIIKEYNPKNIGINKSKHIQYTDELTVSLNEFLEENIDKKYLDRFVSAEKLGVRWLETRVQEEIDILKEICRMTHAVIDKAFTREVIKPGVTTTTDVEWYMRQTMTDLGYFYWFGPDVDLQRKGESNSRLSNTVIEAGDIIHCDIGIKYLGLYSDIQRIAYIAKDNEDSVPKSIEEILVSGNKFQDIFAANFEEKMTGNKIFENTMEDAKSESFKPMLYTHPIGFHGHGAGLSIGKYDNQGPVPVFGDLLLHDSTCYSMELNISQPLEEWDDQMVFAYLEEDIVFQDNEVSFLHGRQDKFILI